MSLALVRVLGWLVIAHGVSHAVLPLRGSLAPAMLIDDWIPAGLYAVGMVGFVAAGLGLLGLRPLDRAISPLLDWPPDCRWWRSCGSPIPPSGSAGLVTEHFSSLVCGAPTKGGQRIPVTAASGTPLASAGASPYCSTWR